MLLNDFCKHVEDLCVILKHVGAKMQFYKETCRKMMLCMQMKDLSAKIRKYGIKMQCSKEKIEIK